MNLSAAVPRVIVDTVTIKALRDYTYIDCTRTAAYSIQYIIKESFTEF